MDVVVVSLMLSADLLENMWGVQTLLLGLVCYFYGSIPFAYLFTYLFKKEHLAQKGTGNIGIANTFGVGGLRAGFLAVFGEATKVALPLVFSRIFYGGELFFSLVFVSATILGNGFSIFLKGKGGQGTTILLWALLLLSPYTLLLFAAVYAFLFLTLRKRYYAVLIGYAMLPFEVLIVNGNVYFAIFGAFAALYYSLRYKPQRSDYSFYSRNMRFLRFIERNFKEKKRVLVGIEQAKSALQVGEKAKSLWYLKNIGVQVPEAYICTFHAFDEYIIGNHDVLNTLETELEKVFEVGKSYSIRSSANLEDDKDYSFAGQFCSYLNVGSIDKILEATVSLWETVNGERVKAYLEHVGRSYHDLKMAVIIQEMVSVSYSGVIFSRNPVTGLDEVIVEAIAGPGSLLLQDGITPERWIYKWGNWIEEPPDSKLDTAVLHQLIITAKKIEKRYGAPVNLEWVYDGSQIYWLQLRRITTIKGIDIYSNKISKGFMPGIIKPLIWSVNIPVVNSAWKQLFIELIGNKAKGIEIHRLAKSYYYRAYFNMGVIGDMFEILGMPRELIEILLGYEATGNEKPKFKPGLKTLKYIPRILLFAAKKSMFSRKIEHLLKKRKVKYDRYAQADFDTMDESETIQAVDRLFKINTDTSYYVIVSQLLMGFYNMLLTRLLARKGLSHDAIDFPRLRDALCDIDPSYQLKQLNSIYTKLPEQVKESFNKSGCNALSDLAGLGDFGLQVKDFLNKFGHLSDSGNDFSQPQWKENPKLVVDMLINYGQTSSQGGDSQEMDRYFVISRRPIINFLYRRASQYRIYREKVNSLYEYGYGLFRPYFLHLAEIFKKKGYLSEPNDIFYLTYSEIQDIAKFQMTPEKHRISLQQRKQQITQWYDIDLPEIIIGDEAPPLLEKKQVSQILRGVAASKGHCQGRTKKVSGIHDFPKVQDGDIIVIPHSDISWTPIFSKAKAVISESGEILSHCAIIAREYKIPAIVSVPHALRLLEDTGVVVDGNKGEILIMTEDENH